MSMALGYKVTVFCSLPNKVSKLSTAEGERNGKKKKKKKSKQAL